MKYLVFVITLLLSFNAFAQNGFENTDVFVRVYDLQGKKIGKGKIDTISETRLLLNYEGKTLEYPVSGIGSIKTKRSGGSNVLRGAATGALTMAIFGVATANPDDFFGYTAGEGFSAGAVFGGIAGAAIGGITILFKNSESYEISGDEVKWKSFKEMLLNTN